MKINILILITFSLFFIFPFFSYGQKADSSSAQTKVEVKFDSTIIKGGIYYLVDSSFSPAKVLPKRAFVMNGKEISDSNLEKCLVLFKQSRWQYLKSKKRSHSFEVLSDVPGVLFVIALPCMIYWKISGHHHFKKAIRLYNEEILKRHK